MIVHEATDADLRAFATFAKRELAAWGYPAPTASPALYRRLIAGGWRCALLREDGAITAVLAVHPLTTDRGPAYVITLWLVARDHPDKIQALDALALFGCNLLRSEGVRLVTSRRDKARHVAAYGHDYLGMEYEGPASAEGGHTDRPVQWGDTEAIIAAILRRRPAWRLL